MFTNKPLSQFIHKKVNEIILDFSISISRVNLIGYGKREEMDERKVFLILRKLLMGVERKF